VVDRLARLGHDTVIGGNNQDYDVGHFCAAGTHCGKGLVTRCIKERDLATLQFHVIRADVLGDAAGLAGNNICLTYGIQQRRLAMVDVTHDRNNRGTFLQSLRRIGGRLKDLIQVHGNVFNLIAVLGGQDNCGIKIKGVVDGYHHTHLHQ